MCTSSELEVKLINYFKIFGLNDLFDPAPIKANPRRGRNPDAQDCTPLGRKRQGRAGLIYIPTTAKRNKSNPSTKTHVMEAGCQV